MGTQSVDRLNRILDALARGDKPGNIAGREGVSVQTVRNAARNYADGIAKTAREQYGREVSIDAAVEQVMTAIRPPGVIPPPPGGLGWRDGFVVLDSGKNARGGVWARISGQRITLSAEAVAALGEPDRIAIGVDAVRGRVAVWPDAGGFKLSKGVCALKTKHELFQEIVGAGKPVVFSGAIVEGGIIFTKEGC